MLTARQQRNGDGDGHKRKCANGLNGTKNSLVNNPQTWQPRPQYIPTYEYIETKVGVGGWGNSYHWSWLSTCVFIIANTAAAADRGPRTEVRGQAELQPRAQLQMELLIKRPSSKVQATAEL